MSDSINAEEGINGIRSIAICPGEVATPILNSRPEPPSAEERSLMAQPEDIAAAALFCASLPQRTCVPRMVVNPTDDRFVRADARAIAARRGAGLSHERDKQNAGGRPMNIRSLDKLSLDGKVAVVTGGTQGLGEAIAHLFADRGAQGLVICGRNADNGAR